MDESCASLPSCWMARRCPTCGESSASRAGYKIFNRYKEQGLLALSDRSGKAVVVESFGLAGRGYHARDEYIEADSIARRLHLMTRLLTELGKQ